MSRRNTGWPAPDRSTYYLAVPPGANARELAAGVGLSAPDLKANTIGDELRLVSGVRGLLNMILQGFMGVGLLAGVAALGTLSTRAVVERRRQIGILRALGFSARAVSVGLLVESAVVALLGAGLGVAIGLFVAHNTVAPTPQVSPAPSPSPASSPDRTARNPKKEPTPKKEKQSKQHVLAVGEEKLASAIQVNPTNKKKTKPTFSNCFFIFCIY